MPTVLIVAIVVAAILIIALLVLLPRMRASARHKQAERELRSRRTAVADEHRSAADEGEQRAELAEQQARVAQQEAERDRAEARLRNERATMHERGMADDELIEEHERDRFDGVAGTSDRDDATDDRARAAAGRDDDRDSVDESRAAPDAPTADHERGRRFERQRITDDVRESERSS